MSKNDDSTAAGCAFFIVVAFFAWVWIDSRVNPPPPPQPTKTPRPTRTPKPTSLPRPTITPGPSPLPPGRGYLWWKDDPTDSVIIIGMSHRDETVDAERLKRWYLRGEACLTPAGTLAWNDSGLGSLLRFDVVLEPIDGPCQGFKGWVPIEAWHDVPPPDQ